jgi:hypothetical protein
MQHVGWYAIWGPSLLLFRITVLPYYNVVKPVLNLSGGVGARRTASTFGCQQLLRLEMIDVIRHKNQQAFYALAA